MRMRLQFFAAPDGGGAGEGGSPSNGQPSNSQQNGNQQAQSFDYDKLASIIAGKQSVTEDTVLKNYFKQQGLSQEEMNQAIAGFKEQKAKNTPDVAGMQTQLTQSQQANQQLRFKMQQHCRLLRQELQLIQFLMCLNLQILVTLWAQMEK